MEKYFNLTKNVVLILSLTLVITSHAQTKWKVKKSSVTFKIKNAGFTVNGSLDSLTAKIEFNDADYSKSSIQASVKSSTINTDKNMRNNHLRKPEYFDAAKYPTITMMSTSFSKVSAGSYKGNFKLTMKDVTKDVVVPFTYNETGSSAVFKGSFTLNRKDYHVGSGSLIMADDLQVDIEINATR